MNLAEAEKLIETNPVAAADMAREAIAINPADAAAHRLLGASLRRLGQHEEAKRAELASIEASGKDPDLIRASAAFKARDYATSERILRAILAERPNEALAIQMLGEIAAAAGLLEDAEKLHQHALAIAPGFEYARLHLANVLNNQGRPADALIELREIKGEILDFEGFRMLVADALSQIGECEEASAVYREILASDPNKPEVWSRLAFLLNAVGKRDEAIEACRSGLKILPASGRIWWSLADLKTYRFGDEDVSALEAAIADPAAVDEDRFRLHFALGKALEDRKNFGASFENYRRGNELAKRQRKYDPEWTGALLQRVRAVFSKEFLDSRAGRGNPSPDPIFIVGMPRSGSTLVEQILASHPLIEGTAELPDINALALSLDDGPRSVRNIRYLDRLGSLSGEELYELGSRYLERTSAHRKTDRPFFIDKMPSNWAHVGFIKAILPSAKIIDVRRHPLACGFSNYKQLFGVGQHFSYDLELIGSYYRDYAAVMAHFDAIAPGMVHRVIHEDLVADPESQIRRLLDFVGLPFDDACLHFHETERSVLTPSSEQVRQPMRADFATQWKSFEAELAPLKRALGPALDHWNDPQQARQS